MGDLTASTSLTVWPHPVTAEGRQTPPVLISVRPGRDIFRSIALIALAVVAPILAPLIFPTLGATALAFATTGIVTVGGLLINALIPIRAPDLGGVENVPLEPVYSLSGGGNRARLYEPLPLVLGRHRVFPDLAAAGFTEFVNGEQFLAQVFHFGLGNIDIEDLRIGTSPLSSYEDVTTRIARGTAVTIFPGNVDTIAGAMLDDTDWVTRVTAANTDRIAIDIVGDLFAIDDGSAILAREVDIVIQWRPRGAASSCAAGWPPGPDCAPRDGTRERDQIQFAALRASQPDTGDYAGQTRLALRVRASGQLSGRLDRLSALVHQKVPVYRNGAWTTGNERSSNPAAIFRWYARGIFVRGRLAAGAGLRAARIDDDNLAAWYTWCGDQGLACDLVLQSAATHDEILGAIAQCGRAAMTWATGRLGVVYEEAERDVTGLVTPGNILEGTFRVDWPPGGLADEIVVRFVDPENDWRYSSVRRTRPGLTGPPVTSSTITARGITNRDHAAIECNLTAARQHYHRRRHDMGNEPRGPRLHEGRRGDGHAFAD